MKIVRQPQSQPLAQPTGEWDPFRMMREMMRWDPFREMTPLFSSDLGKLSFVPDIDVKETAEASRSPRARPKSPPRRPKCP